MDDKNSREAKKMLALFWVQALEAVRDRKDAEERLVQKEKTWINWMSYLAPVALSLEVLRGDVAATYVAGLRLVDKEAPSTKGKGYALILRAAKGGLCHARIFLGEHYGEAGSYLAKDELYDAVNIFYCRKPKTPVSAPFPEVRPRGKGLE